MGQAMRVLGLAAVVALAGACSATVDVTASGGAAAPAVGVWHLVYVDLVDPSRLDELRADCDRLLAPIPAVLSYTCGTPLDTGRDNVSGDYDLALVLGHADEAGYRAYLEHGDHVALVTKWRGHMTLTIHDVADERRRR